VSYQPYPSAPPPPPEPQQPVPTAAERPRALHWVVMLLVVNLALSIGLTIAVLALQHSVITFQLNARHITDPHERELLRSTYKTTIWIRVATNVVVSVYYAFLVRALLRGRRWAYRRVVWLSAAGIVALVAIWLTPYPTWMRGEQVAQACVLAGLLYFVLRPEVRGFLQGGSGRRWSRR
jgi:uncharacterized membrane protein